MVILLSKTPLIKLIAKLGMKSEVYDKLAKMGVSTVEDLLLTPSEEIREKTGLSRRIVRRLIEEAGRLIEIRAESAYQVSLRMRETIAYITTGSSMLDEILGGGIETNSVTEVFGPYGAGKTQLAMQLCINVQLPRAQGGLSSGALYIDTEGAFSSRRVAEMAEMRGMDPSQTLSAIKVVRAISASHQHAVISSIDRIVDLSSIKLIVVDSLLHHYRSEYPELYMLPARQQAVREELATLTRIAEEFNLAVLITNHVLSPIRSERRENAAGGHTLAHLPKTRVYIRKAPENMRIARVVDSPILPEREAPFRITEAGIEDI